MTAFKRKNESVNGVPDNLTKMVIVGNSNDGEENQPPPTVRTMERMKQLRSQLEQQQKQDNDDYEDPIARTMLTMSIIINNNDNDYHNDGDECEEKTDNDVIVDQDVACLVQHAREIQSRLSEEIEYVKSLCHQESNVLSQLQSQLIEFQEKRQQLMYEIESLEDRQRTSQQRIAIYQEEASEQLDIIADVEDEQKRQVPRLKTTISLYASTTGIKWDFAHPDLVSGQVAMPSNKGFKLFSIDPRDHSPVETADKLWDLMEGN